MSSLRERHNRDMRGSYKSPGGKLVSVDVDSDGETIDSVRIAGDFFAEPDDIVLRMEQSLSGVPAQVPAQELAQIVQSSLLPGDTLMGVSPRAVATAIRRALGKAIDWEDLELEVIHGPEVEPVINVALDETLVADVAAGTRKPFLRFWEWNGPQIVMGSFQSYENEINQEGIDRHGITVSRRISGGGAMFMEPGNCITYSLVIPTALVDGMTFEESYPFLDQWVMEALQKVGVQARYVPLNDIASDKGKIAGAAQKRFASGYTLHHVTMAYDIDAEKMMECLRIGKEKIRDKGLRSAVKRVDPMRSQTGMPRAEIIESFKQTFIDRYDAVPGALTERDLSIALRKADEKFTNPDWIHRVP